MQVILQENIENLGHVGDVVTVSDGYARNFLLPRNLVVVANRKNLALIEHHKRLLEKKRLAQRVTAQELAERLVNFSCTVKRKVGENEKLYGSVSVGDILESLKSGGFQIEKKALHLEGAIKTLGVHTVKVKLENEISVPLKVWVVKEE